MVLSSGPVMMLLVLCYALWGGGMIAMKYAFESFDVLHVVFARVAFAALFYLSPRREALLRRVFRSAPPWPRGCF